jgi:hypothetical protein
VRGNMISTEQLRNLGFLSARQGRSILDGLLDDHVTDILDRALSHAEHLRDREVGTSQAVR